MLCTCSIIQVTTMRPPGSHQESNKKLPGDYQDTTKNTPKSNALGLSECFPAS